MLDVIVFIIQTLLELSSNLFTNIPLLGTIDTLSDPVDILMSGILTFFHHNN